jgi:hypothetical protein
VKDRNDLNPGRLCPVEHAERKPRHDGFANVREHHGMQLRVGRDPVEHFLDAVREVYSEFGLLRLVIIEGFVELGLASSRRTTGRLTVSPSPTPTA